MEAGVRPGHQAHAAYRRAWQEAAATGRQQTPAVLTILRCFLGQSFDRCKGPNVPTGEVIDKVFVTHAIEIG